MFSWFLYLGRYSLEIWALAIFLYDLYTLLLMKITEEDGRKLNFLANMIWLTTPSNIIDNEQWRSYKS